MTIQESSNEKATLIERVFIILFSAIRRDIKSTLIVILIITCFYLNGELSKCKGEAAVIQKEFRHETIDLIESITGLEVKKQVEPIRKTVKESTDSIRVVLKDMKNDQEN